MEVKYSACSGVMPDSELTNWTRNLSYMVSGVCQLPNEVTWSSWISGPTSWPLIETVSARARNFGLQFQIDNIKTTGWIFKESTYAFTVKGDYVKFSRFSEWFHEFVKINS